MKRINFFITLFLLIIVIEVCGETTIENLQFCKGIDVQLKKDSEGNLQPDFSQPITCVEETQEFLTTENEAYAVIKLVSPAQNDEIIYKILDASGTPIKSDPLVVTEDFDVWYDYRKIEIVEQGMGAGRYSIEIYINGVEVILSEIPVPSTFIIREPADCVASEFYCCQPPKVCIDPRDEACPSAFCCASEADCKTLSYNAITRREITNCIDEGLTEAACGKVVKLYDYRIGDQHVGLQPAQPLTFIFRGLNIDCYDKTAVTLAYYDETNEEWVEKVTNVETTDIEDIYRATAMLDYFGYIALIRSEACVPNLCTYGGYRTNPLAGYVEYGNTITFELCGMVSGCEAIENDNCNSKCTSNVDPDCVDDEGNPLECTSNSGDCCLISKDDKYDPDCDPTIEPDYCDKSKELCCPTRPVEAETEETEEGIEEETEAETEETEEGIEEETEEETEEITGGVEECDNNCGISDTLCTDIDCTSAGGDCCSADGYTDGVCDPDCPKLSNGVGYVDVDCCELNVDGTSREDKIPITSVGGDCCAPVCDGRCDPDCIIGLDPDCYYDCVYCGDGTCQGGEDCDSCPRDCGECLEYGPDGP